MNWLKARQNKDNFWNLMFWFGISFSFFLTMLLGELLNNTVIDFILSWTTILIVPYLTTRFNKVIYTDDKIFLNSQGDPLTERLPKKLLWAIFSAIAVAAFTGSELDKNWLGVSELIAFPLLVSVFIFVFTLYFIIKNCPISLLFNKNSWHESIIGMRPGITGSNNGISSQPWHQDISRSNSGGNIYNPYRR